MHYDIFEESLRRANFKSVFINLKYLQDFTTS